MGGAGGQRADCRDPADGERATIERRQCYVGRNGSRAAGDGGGDEGMGADRSAGDIGGQLAGDGDGAAGDATGRNRGVAAEGGRAGAAERGQGDTTGDAAEGRGASVGHACERKVGAGNRR